MADFVLLLVYWGGWVAYPGLSPGMFWPYHLGKLLAQYVQEKRP